MLYIGVPLFATLGCAIGVMDNWQTPLGIVYTFLCVFSGYVTYINVRAELGRDRLL